jgi:excisionase family DNA binding protein
VHNHQQSRFPEMPTRSKNVHIDHLYHTRELSPRQVAEAIGVSVSSLKRWCDRGDLPVTKTAGGHRRIARSAVVRFLRDRGFDAKRPDLLGLPAGARLEARDAKEVLPQVVSSLIAGEEDRLLSLLTGLFLAQRSMAQIADEFLQPAFERVGAQWAAGALQIYQEHRAVAITRNVLQRLRSYLPSPSPHSPKAISATLAGDPYLMPIMLTELVLREIGWNAIALGPNHPPETLALALADMSPRLACLSVSFIQDEEELVAGVEEIYAKANELGIAVTIGGSRLDLSLRSRLPCTAHCRNMQELVSLARGLEPTLSPKVS